MNSMRKGLFQYHCWGLNIHSELECPELIDSTGIADVCISMGKTPDSLPNVKIRGVRYELTINEFLLNVDNVARYYVVNGESIIIEPYKNADHQSLRLFLLGSAFGALLQQRGIVAMHASVMEMKGQAVMFCGPSAMGKSTLAATLYQRGYRMLSDDVCVVKLDEAGKPIAIPGYPQFKLWADVLNHLELKYPDKLDIVRLGLEKYALNVRDGFCCSALPLRAIYLINRTNTPTFEVKHVRGIEKFTALYKNTYRIQFLEELAEKSFHHELCAAIAKNVEMMRLIRPDKPFLPNKLADLVEKDFS